MNISPRAQQKFRYGSRIATGHDLLDDLTEMVAAESQTKVARGFGISVPFLNDILHGRRGVSAYLARRMGYERIVVFVRDEDRNWNRMGKLR